MRTWQIVCRVDIYNYSATWSNHELPNSTWEEEKKSSLEKVGQLRINFWPHSLPKWKWIIHEKRRRSGHDNDHVDDDHRSYRSISKIRFELSECWKSRLMWLSVSKFQSLFWKAERSVRCSLTSQVPEDCCPENVVVPFSLSFKFMFSARISSSTKFNSASHGSAYALCTHICTLLT